jgi:type I restriction enzyme, S subunit
MVGPSTVCETRNLREVVTKLVDGSHNPPPKQETGLPMLSARNIDRGQVLFDDYRLISESAFVSENARTRIAAGDVLLTIVGTIGRTAVVPDGSQPFALQRSVAVLTPAANLLPKFLCYQLQSPAIQRHFEANARGTAQKGVYLKTLGQTPIVLPPLNEQTEIVAEIEKQFSRLDEAVANLQRVKANLKRYKASVLKYAVEGRLVPTEAEIARREGRSFETGEQLLQRAINGRSVGGKARRRKADLAALPRANLRETSDGWIWTTTGEVCECIVPNRDKPQTFSGDIPWLTLPDFDDSEITVARSKSELGFTESEVALYRAKAIPIGSVVMSCVGRFGISAVLTRKAVINQQLHAFLPSEAVVSKYLAYVLRTREQEMLQKSTATTIAYLNKENCNSITVPLPPLAEQARIVAEVDRRLSLVRSVESEVDGNLKRAQALRESNLASAFKGNSGN